MIHKTLANPIVSFSAILRYIFPIICISCHKHGAYLCPQCKKKLEPHPEICAVTHRFSPDFQVHVDARRDVAYEGIAIGFAYTSLLKKLILQLKYYHCYDISSFLIERLTLVIQTNQTLHRLMQKKKVIITSIPSHRYRKYFVKGYNQSQLLAQGVASSLGMHYQSLLIKNKHTRIQAFLSRKQRQNNLHNVFSLKENISLSGDELIVIVDDVTTTGSTINAVASELKSHYPKLKIRGAVLCRHV